jgi:hypothetical protein
MLAVLAAILFGLALLLDLTDVDLGDTFTLNMLVTAGLLCMALHLAGLGVRTSGWRRRARR